MEPLWPTGKPIPEAKLKDLKSLLHLIPQEYHSFYVNLDADKHIEDDLEGFSDHVVLQQERAHAHAHAARSSAISTGTDLFTDLGLHDKKMCMRNDSFTDHGFHDKHIKVEAVFEGYCALVVWSWYQEDS
ncbi:hypothetical protein MSG28_013523 [Choristoneura fumiferana]|uniref:Uncharacterized protein n=1 Tax=Choristoneura fumiferana TaxID=7141 RepID=A0ACC0K914_CHOFU|nr:hypothetical protein MSG28_013523 [Choristoneura fumiferana]